MSNPLALATANQLVSSKQGQKAIGNAASALQYLAIGVGLYFTGKFAWGKFKEVRAKNFANQNIGNPDLIAASIIYESFTRIGFPASSILSFILNERNISTDEASLYQIASEVTNIKSVANSYKILYDRNLMQDLQEGLSNKEAQSFWKILKSPQFNNDTDTLYGIGLMLYSAVKGKEIRVNKAVQQANGKWEGTNESYGNFKNGELIGAIISNGVYKNDKGEEENYYVVEQTLWQAAIDGSPFNSKNTGVVLQHQVTDVKN